MTLDDVTIYTFHQVMTTGDTTLLKVENSEVVWDALLEEYASLIGKEDNSYRWSLTIQVNKLSLRLKYVAKAYEILLNGAATDELKEQIKALLKKYGAFVDTETENAVEQIERKLKAMQYKIDLKDLELKAVTPEKKEDSLVWDLTKDLYAIGKILEIKYKIDPKETSAKLYCIMVDDAKKTIERNGKR